MEVRATSLVGTLTNLSLLPVRHVACIVFRRRASSILPSYLKRKGEERFSKAKKAKTPVKTWDRDIVCLPDSLMEKNKYIPFPRGKTRALLARNCLIGKLHISSEMSESDVFCEMRSVFKDAMQGDPNFPFKLLQPTGEGSRSLAIPPVSDTFHWTAQQVSKLGGSRGCIYILAEAELRLPELEVCMLCCFALVRTFSRIPSPNM